jgi:hypothetical protein
MMSLIRSTICFFTFEGTHSFLDGSIRFMIRSHLSLKSDFALIALSIKDFTFS